jgi:hypothetical protein
VATEGPAGGASPAYLARLRQLDTGSFNCASDPLPAPETATSSGGGPTHVPTPGDGYSELCPHPHISGHGHIHF